MLTIVDTFSRFSPAVEPRFNFRGADVVEVLEEVGRQVGFPTTIRVDQGTEFVSRDLDLWAYQRGVTLDFSRPGKPTDNAFIESFNGKFRAECLNAHWFMSLDDARRKCEAWRRDYNEERPHSAIGNKARSSSSIDQRHTARPDRNILEKGQQAGPRMGSSSSRPDSSSPWINSMGQCQRASGQNERGLRTHHAPSSVPFNEPGSLHCRLGQKHTQVAQDHSTLSSNSRAVEP